MKLICFFTITLLYISETNSQYSSLFKRTDVNIEYFQNLYSSSAEPLSENAISALHCAAKCLWSKTCGSFYFDILTQNCQLHSLVYLPSYENETTETTHYYIPKCGDNPPFSNLSLVTMDGANSINNVCNAPATPDEVTCASSGTFTSFLCKKPASCAEARYCADSLPDGEYWLYPEGLGGETRVRIYCHNMDTDPQEFLTLPVPNSGEWPNRARPGCFGAEGPQSNKNWGTWTYNKLKVNLTTMIVDRIDPTFASTSNTLFRYGEAKDCYTTHSGSNVCGPVGTFNIDTSGTGLIFDPSISWYANGWLPWAIVSRSADGTMVDLTCGGYCGGCMPDGPMKLLLNPRDEPDESTAVAPASCVFRVTRKFN